MTPDGRVDPLFADGDASIGNLDSLGAIAVQADGRIVIAGSAGQAMLVARLGSDGLPDASFGGTGIEILPLPTDRATSLALRANGSIVVAGDFTANPSLGQGVVAQLTGTGMLDTAWGNGGWVLVQSDQGGLLTIDAIALQSDDKVLVGGTNIDFAHNAAGFVARLDEVGQRDFTFGLGGFVDRSAVPADSHVNGLGIQTGGNVVAAGDLGSGAPFAMRFSREGVLDTSYGVGGVAQVAQIRSDDWIASVFNTDGAARFIGYTNLASNDQDVLLVQLQGQAIHDEPDAFEFATVSGVPVAQFVTSAPVTITGINVPVAISVSNGDYSLGCNGTFTNSPASITNGQTVCVRVMSCDVGSCSSQAQLTVGPVSAFFTVQTGVLPDTSVTSLPATSPTSARFALASNDPVATFRCSLDGAPFAPCTSPLTLTGLAQGDHVLQVAAVNAIGADASPAQATWRIDTIPPETTITSGPEGKKNPDDATFEFVSSEAGSTFECSLDQAAFAARTSPTTYQNLDKGWHTFQVRARDAAGNVDPTPASVTWKSKKK